MYYDIKNERVTIVCSETSGKDGAREEIVTDTVPVASFGCGSKAFVVIPGLGDGLKTVEGLAGPMLLAYRRFAKNRRVHMMSRRSHIPEGYSIRDMAGDIVKVMDALDIESADVLGVSQGGMIAEELALLCPERVDRLVLTVTVARPNPTVEHVVGDWIKMAEAGDLASIIASTAELSYTPARLKKIGSAYRMAAKVAGRLGKDKVNFSRYLAEARACLEHDAYDRLPEIKAPTLVLGGTDDKIVTGDASREIAKQIPGALLHMFKGFGHGLYEEAPDFQEWVEDFITAGDQGGTE